MGFPRDVAAEILKQYIVPVDATVLIAVDGIEGGEMLDRSAIAACLLAYLPRHSLFDGLSKLNDPSGNAPLPLAWLPAPQNEEYFFLPNDYSSDAGDGIRRVLPARGDPLRPTEPQPL